MSFHKCIHTLLSFSLILLITSPVKSQGFFRFAKEGASRCFFHFRIFSYTYLLLEGCSKTGFANIPYRGESNHEITDYNLLTSKTYSENLSYKSIIYAIPQYLHKEGRLRKIFNNNIAMTNNVHYEKTMFALRKISISIDDLFALITITKKGRENLREIVDTLEKISQEGSYSDIQKVHLVREFVGNNFTYTEIKGKGKIFRKLREKGNQIIAQKSPIDCLGYSKITEYLLLKLDVNAVMTHNECHAFNAVFVDPEEAFNTDNFKTKKGSEQSVKKEWIIFEPIGNKTGFNYYDLEKRATEEDYMLFLVSGAGDYCVRNQDDTPSDDT